MKVAMLLITVVVVFIGCNMIRICINTYEVIHTLTFLPFQVRCSNEIDIMKTLVLSFI